MTDGGATVPPDGLRALRDLGIGEAELARLGLRLIRLGMPFPVDAAELAALTAGLDEVLVVEDKVPFLEGHLKEALYRRPDAPLVVGRRDEDGRPLLTARGTIRSAPSLADDIVELQRAMRDGDAADAPKTETTDGKDQA